MRVVLISMLVLSFGCVSRATYDALQSDHSRTSAELAQEEARARSLAEKLSQLEKELGSTQKDKSSLESNVEQMRQALAELRKRKLEADARIAEFKALIAKFRTLIDAGKIKVRMREGRMLVELATDVLFPSASANLNNSGRSAVSEVSKLLASIPDRRFQVEGHTDNVPIRSRQYPSNWELAAARALTVLNTMVEAGMKPERISAASFGSSHPAKPNDTAENKAANRRIEIVVVPDLSSLPGFDELQRASAG